MNEQIESNNDYSRIVTTQRNQIWYFLKFDATIYLEKCSGDEVMEVFEKQVENLRQRLKTYYGKD